MFWRHLKAFKITETFEKKLQAFKKLDDKAFSGSLQNLSKKLPIEICKLLKNLNFKAFS